MKKRTETAKPIVGRPVKAKPGRKPKPATPTEPKANPGLDRGGWTRAQLDEEVARMKMPGPSAPPRPMRAHRIPNLGGPPGHVPGKPPVLIVSMAIQANFASKVAELVMATFGIAVTVYYEGIVTYQATPHATVAPVAPKRHPRRATG